MGVGADSKIDCPGSEPGPDDAPGHHDPGRAAEASPPPLGGVDRFCSTARDSSSALSAWALASAASTAAFLSARAFSAPALAALAWACSFLTAVRAVIAVW